VNCKVIRAHGAALAMLVASAATHALQVTGATPQGEVAQVRQVVLKFDAAAVAFGDPKAAAPAALSCSDAQASQGNGRWTGEREWVFEFANDLPPGVNCTVQLRTGFKSPQGSELAPRSWRFTTGGPFVQQIRPSRHERIDEEQFFVLQLNGPATVASAQQNVWCAVDGLGERVPVRLLASKEREALLKSLRMDKAAAQEPLRFLTFACNRMLPPDGRVHIVYGKGVGKDQEVVQRGGEGF
jgi:alpha-2-macroglobulin